MEENKGEEMKGVEWKQKVGLEVGNKHYFGYGIIIKIIVYKTARFANFSINNYFWGL